jgi:Polyketide cyclase / dehydrase and lipid transport
VEANRNAPVFSRRQIEISASPETVWDLMADIKDWPSWNPDVREVSVEGDIAGNRVPVEGRPWDDHFHTPARGRPRSLGWTSRTFGIDAIHVWRFEPRGEMTVAGMEESFEGVTAKLFRKRLQKELDATTLTGRRLLNEVRNLVRLGSNQHPKGQLIEGIPSGI